jgi:hypothetical protein
MRSLSSDIGIHGLSCLYLLLYISFNGVDISPGLSYLLFSTFSLGVVDTAIFDYISVEILGLTPLHIV